MDEISGRAATVWDLPTRIFHGLLAAAAVGLFVTGKIGGDAMPWHARLGYGVGALLMFRVAWGFAGGRWSRFAAFPPSPVRAWSSLRGTAMPSTGHTPLGALSIYAMLLFFALQVGSGLFSETKDDFAGPLSAFVSNATVHVMTGYHKRVGQYVLIALVVLHVAAIAVYAWRGERLWPAMWHGRKWIPPQADPSRDDKSTRLLAVVLMSLCSLVMWLIVKIGG
jgi:cytochrome b